MNLIRDFSIIRKGQAAEMVVLLCQQRFHHSDTLMAVWGDATVDTVTTFLVVLYFSRLFVIVSCAGNNRLPLHI